jgi:hypothetical protein
MDNKPKGPNDEMWDFWKYNDGPFDERLSKYIKELKSFETPASIKHEDAQEELLMMRVDASLISHSASFRHLKKVRRQYHHILIEANISEQIDYFFQLYTDYLAHIN